MRWIASGIGALMILVGAHDESLASVQSSVGPAAGTSPRPGSSRASTNPEQTLSVLQSAAKATIAKPPPTRSCPPDDPNCFTPSAGRTLSGFLRWTSADVNQFWGKRMRAAGFRWVAARSTQIAAGNTARSKCLAGPVAAATPIGPFYCDADGPGAVYLPLSWLKQFLFPRSEFRTRDFALAYIVAHEGGHHLQHVTGILANPKLTSLQIELQADCLAGVWAYSTWARQLLEPGDIEEAVRLARRIGDVPGTPSNDPSAHGSPRQRAAWFRRGYGTGDPDRCRTQR